MSDTTRRPLSARERRRRTMLQVLAGFCVGLPRIAVSETLEGDTNPPQENDWLVFAFGDRAGEPIAPQDLAVGAKQVFAYPQDATTGRLRNGTRLNQVVLTRLDSAGLAPETLARAVEGVVAYSGVCSHTGCDVTDWFADVGRFKCPCHESMFDPSDGARVIGGPAPWPLAALPLKVVDGKLAVAGAFVGQVGFQQPGLDPFSPL